MSKFIYGKHLEDTIYDIIWNAEMTLLIVSPFIKLDDYFKKLFLNHINNPKIHIKIVFGKNEDDKGKSLRREDFEFFKNFLNISIIYVPNLHAKYYANDKCGVITSINLHDYSFKNNIEFGVYNELSIIDHFKKNIDEDAWNTCMNIIDNNEVVYIKRPMYEKKLLSSIFGKNYIKSEILFDNTEKFYSRNHSSNSNNNSKLNDYPTELELGSNNYSRPLRNEINKPIEILETKNKYENNNYELANKTKNGYCIRTGVEIRFNLEKPYSYDAFLEWNGDEHFPENYCHYSGEKSNGITSFYKPILKKHWKQAREEFDF